MLWRRQGAYQKRRKKEMKSKKKAPKVNKYNFNENYMQESDRIRNRKSPMAPMRKKRLSD
jgi:hypothetical protein